MVVTLSTIVAEAVVLDIGAENATAKKGEFNMMKKKIKNAIAIALLVGFAVLALGSFGSSPSSRSSGSGNSSSGCPSYGSCWVEFRWSRSTETWSMSKGVNCSSRNCDVNRIIAGGAMGPEGTYRCDCSK